MSNVAELECKPRVSLAASPSSALLRESARREAGYDSLKVPARKLGLSERYLRSLELHGGAPYHTAVRLSRFYDCPLMLWI